MTGSQRTCRTPWWTPGPSLDWEVVFFNQVAKSPLPEYKRRWFRSDAFRRAISDAIHRDDIARIVYRGHARPAAGPVSVTNRFWRNAALKAARLVRSGTRWTCSSANGFYRSGGALFDHDGHQVEFSMITNAGNKLHERTLALIQQDLAQIGVQFNVVTLDFPSLVERISRSFNYEAVLMAFHKRGSGSQRADEHLAERGGEPSMESQPENAGDRRGRPRSTN